MVTEISRHVRKLFGRCVGVGVLREGYGKGLGFARVGHQGALVATPGPDSEYADCTVSITVQLTDARGGGESA